MNKIQVIRKKYIYGVNYYEVRECVQLNSNRYSIKSTLKTCSKSEAFKHATKLRTEYFPQFEYINEA